jgi:hypothetical protein
MMKLPADDLPLAEEQSEALQDLLDEALKVLLCAVELARITAATVARVDPKLFATKASTELRELSKSYAKIAKLDLPKNMLKASPEMIRKAVTLLRVTP